MNRPIVIIAAGQGSRIQGLQGDIPKPLIRLCGLMLIERAIKSAKRAGFEKFVIVVGFEAEKITSALGDGSQYGVHIEYVVNPEWDKKNGVSVLKAKEKIIEDEFVLLMSDHILDKEFFPLIQNTPLDSCDLVLLVDYKINQVFDMDDATKVMEKNALIETIGKEIPSYNCIDTGAFIISKRFFDRLESVYQAQGDVSLSEGVQALVNEKKASVCDIGNLWWQDVDTKEAYLEAQRVMLKKQIKPTDVFVSKHFNRPVSLFFTKYLVRTKLTPNQVTYISLLSGFAAPFFLVWGIYWGFVWGAFFYHFASVLDGCDGEMARLKMMESTGGEWVDTIIDNVTHLLFVGGLSLGLSRFLHQTWPLVIGVVSMVSITVLVVLMFLHIHKIKRGTLLAFDKSFEAQTQDGFMYKLGMILKPLLRRATYAFIFVFMALLGWNQAILILMTIAPIVTLVILSKTFFLSKKPV